MLDVRAGSRIGPYKVIAPLEEVSARGGMSTLFLAQLAQVDGTQLLLLKLVPVEETGGERSGMRALNALRKEVELLQRLRHPNIVKIYPIPSRNDGRREHYVSRATNVPGGPWYCTMEYLGGGSLETRLQELTVMPIEEAVEIAYQIGSALDYMHAKGYVHWDVKPDNILFREPRSENGRTQAVLTDFGIARSTHEPAVVAGSVPYMSPERLRVHTGEIPTDQVMDQRPADVYALGVVLYEMLADSLPYAAEAGEDLKAAILKEPLIPLSDFNYEVPSVLEGVIFQALEKDPANRPTAEEMVTMLDRAVPAPRLGVQAATMPGPAAEEAVGRVRPAPRRAPRRREEQEEVAEPERPGLVDRLGQLALAVVGVALIAFIVYLLLPGVLPGPPQITEVMPSQLQKEKGSVFVKLEGENFQDDMEVYLTDMAGSRIRCMGVDVSGGRKADCSLDLADAEGGNWTLEVRQDNGSDRMGVRVVVPTPTPTPTPLPPTVSVGGPYSGGRNETVTLDAGGSSDPDGEIAAYQWEIDGRQVCAEATCQLDLSQFGVGQHVVRLTVTDESGAAADANTTLTVENVKPIADAGGPYSGEQGETITLDGSGSEDPDGEITAYEWEIDGEGVDCSEETCEEVSLGEYEPDSEHTVKLVVTDKDGTTGEATAELTIAAREQPVERVSGADLVLTSPSGCIEHNPTLQWQGGRPPYTVLVNGQVQGSGVSGTSLAVDLGGQVGGVSWEVQSSDGQTARGNFTYGPFGGCEPPPPTPQPTPTKRR